MHQQVEKEKEHLKSELKQMKLDAEATKAYIDSQQIEERKLLKIIQEADSERLRQKKQLDQVIQERDILGTQLVRRNDELALLYEKIKIQQSTLNKGEIQYKSRVEDIRILKLEIKRLRREKKILSVKVSNVDDLRFVEINHHLILAVFVIDSNNCFLSFSLKQRDLSRAERAAERANQVSCA